MSHELELHGLDGSNPLAFLAALGTLRILTISRPDDHVRMSWNCTGGAWRPTLTATDSLEPDAVVDELDRQLRAMADHPAFHALGDNLNVPPATFHRFATEARDAATPADRAGADFAAAFGCEATTTQNNHRQTVIQDTALRTMSGAGNQHFLHTVCNLASNCEARHLHRTLFEPWRYEDPLSSRTMRWDPADDRRYALRARDPGGGEDAKEKKQHGSMLGANRLAVEAMPLMSTMPAGSRLRTTGFSGTGARNTFWTWPIWEPAIPLDVCRSLLALPELQRDRPPRPTLRCRGIVEVFRSQRITEGQYRNFTPAQSV